MSFLTLFFPSADRPGLGGTLAGALPYFFKLKSKEEKGFAEVLSLDASRTQSRVWQEKYGSQYITFTFSAIALAARLVHIDGEANEAEVKAFYDHFPMPGGSKEKGADLFYEAYIDTADSAVYAKKITGFYPSNQTLYKQVLTALIRLAFADAPVNREEYALLRKVAVIFDINEEEFKQLLREYIIPQGSDPYSLLGAKPRATHDDIKRAYRDVIKACHPDSFVQYDLPQEVKSIMIEKFKRLTNAYEAICKFRKFEG